jgi:phosphoglycerate dehydrogenase-like enzyme
MGTPELTGDINVVGVSQEVWPDYPAAPSVSALATAEFAVPPYMGKPEGLKCLAEMPNLQVCQLLTIGYDDVLAHVAPSVTVCNAKGVHEESTGELAVALLLALVKSLPLDVRNAGSGRWQHFRRGSLAGLNVVILGAGGVAAAITERLAPFGCNVTMIGKKPRGKVRDLGDLPQLLKKTQALFVALPLTDETRGLVDQTMLAHLPDGAFVINVARGPVAVTEAIVSEATSGRLNFALDVVDPEPLPPDHALWSLPNVLITPHVGGNTDAFPVRGRRLVREQLENLLMGAPLVNVVRAGK